MDVRSYLVELVTRGKRLHHHVIEDKKYFKTSYGMRKMHEWLADTLIFTERNLQLHPLYKSINEKIADNNEEAISLLCGYLNSVLNDEHFWKQSEILISEKDVTHILDAKNEVLYDVFLSHANKDKNAFVDKLKASLDKLDIKIFYDKESIEWGDDWKQKILDGVGSAEFAIIVISENFFGREWTERELAELLSRQNNSGQKIILPILHNITIEQLKTKYPEIADIQAIDSNKTTDEIALMFANQFIKRLKTGT